MRSSFRLSLICNLSLVAILIIVLTQQRKATTVHAPIEPAQVASGIVPATPAAESNLFQWSQIESTNDYRDYVANLRSIGCPEPTVEDIVWGDAERAFSHQRRQLNLGGNEPGPWSNQREAEMVAFFLGQRPAPVESHQENAAPVAVNNRKSGPPIYPLAFRDVNLDKLGLTDAQKQGVQQAIAGLRQQFIEQIGGLNQDPSDPAYLERWKKAQPQADAILRGWLGGKTFMAYELAAQAKAGAAP